MNTENDRIEIEKAYCPVPLTHSEQIVMGHGSGGKMSHDLIHKVFLPCFDNPALRAGDDAAFVSLNEQTGLAISTDTHTVDPLFFPGGDIGKLSVCGTVNDIISLLVLFSRKGWICKRCSVSSTRCKHQPKKPVL
jgi:hydrogenase expression/formation protein HypE